MPPSVPVQSVRIGAEGRQTTLVVLLTLMLLAIVPGQIAAANDECLICHDDPTLKSASGKLVAVETKHYAASIHRERSCRDCHTQPGDFDEIPHYAAYRPVDCSNCHQPATSTFGKSFHGRAQATGHTDAPNCISCHSASGSPHRIAPLTERDSEIACRRCHNAETERYDRGVHAEAASRGKESPGCVGCHPTHSQALPPSAGAVNRLCEACHPGSMKEVSQGEHKQAFSREGSTISCASCHDVHATHKPHLDTGVLEACNTCHSGYRQQFIGTVHEPLLKQERMNCLSCHRIHQVIDAAERENFGCGACHVVVESGYRTSAHRLARLHGDRTAATCADCHGGHRVRAPSDHLSPVYRDNIPATCGICHSDASVVTADYVRLPISLPSYMGSVHGKRDDNDHHPAVCTDCHGTHRMQSASDPGSHINRQNISATCGKCHPVETTDFVGSIHGRALALGIKHAPGCTECHEEHLIRPVHDENSSLSPANQALQTCGKCHEDPAMAARYGLPLRVIESYEDSYHSWAIKRGARNVATCTDCHNTHDIRASLDPTSSTHKENVVATCARCHPNSNAEFAASYTHILARDRMMIHDWVRVIYIWLIVLLLGGMFLHNLVIFIRELGVHKRRHLEADYVVRMTKSEIWQHILLAVTFSGLAITGFALRYPDQWWVHVLKELGMSEEVRRLIHRSLAVAMVAASIYHVWYMIATRRGRMLLLAMFPKFSDIGEALGNLAYYLRLREHPPRFGHFDYTQKAEYWALIWGTVVMTLTGLILWFPALATGWLPAWVVRVCEVIHFYEAILAVSAIVIWHFFFTIFLPKEYPMSWTWLTGRMSKDEWKHHHPRAEEEVEAIEVKREEWRV
ncbi:MAG: DUF4405 domain-containing protein [Calditrichaeota bacterium]|nr:DUF4405 domain-containing protein [Calditrichota bacterium]